MIKETLRKRHWEQDLQLRQKGSSSCIEFFAIVTTESFEIKSLKTINTKHVIHITTILYIINSEGWTQISIWAQSKPPLSLNKNTLLLKEWNINNNEAAHTGGLTQILTVTRGPNSVKPNLAQKDLAYFAGWCPSTYVLSITYSSSLCKSPFICLWKHYCST